MLMQFTVAEWKRNEDNSQVDCTTHILSVTAVAFKVSYILFVVGNNQTSLVKSSRTINTLPVLKKKWNTFSILHFSLKKTIVCGHQ